MSADSAKQMPPGGGPGGHGLTKEQIQKFMTMNYKYRGTSFATMVVPRDNLEAMDTFEVREDDIFVLTYPKCGTHWCMEIVYLILADGYLDKIDRSEKMKFGGLEMSIPDLNLQQPAYKFVETVASPRVLPTHLPENILPPVVFKNRGKVVYVTRNPKDCLTSLIRFMNKIAGLNNLDEVFEQFLSDDMLNGNFFDFNLAYWKHRHDDNFLFMKYEDMKRDTRSAVIKIADHIGHPLTEDAVDRVVTNSSMDQMKKSYQKADEEGVMPAFGGKGQESLGKFLRKGEIGDWKNTFTVAMNERFDQYYKEKLAGSGLTFEFE